MIDILKILPSPPPLIRVLDIGAMMAGDEPYESLRSAGIARITGFEPQQPECERLNAIHGPAGHRYFPYFIGDGSARTFHLTRDGFSSSLYEPNLELVSRFQNLGELYQIMRTGPVQTRRLDDLPDIRPVDLVKIDTQGAELDVIRGGAATIGEALVVHTEVEFVPMYKNQPLFADVDTALRELGFAFLKFYNISGPPFVPVAHPDEPTRRISQMLWGDAVYVRSFMSFDALSPAQLIKLAAMVHMMYNAVDLAHLALAHHDRVAGTALAPAYLQALSQLSRSKPGTDAGV